MAWEIMLDQDVGVLTSYLLVWWYFRWTLCIYDAHVSNGIRTKQVFVLHPASVSPKDGLQLFIIFFANSRFLIFNQCRKDSKWQILSKPAACNIFCNVSKFFICSFTTEKPCNRGEREFFFLFLKWYWNFLCGQHCLVFIKINTKHKYSYLYFEIFWL